MTSSALPFSLLKGSILMKIFSSYAKKSWKWLSLSKPSTPIIITSKPCSDNFLFLIKAANSKTWSSIHLNQMSRTLLTLTSSPFGISSKLNLFILNFGGGLWEKLDILSASSLSLGTVKFSIPQVVVESRLFFQQQSNQLSLGSLLDWFLEQFMSITILTKSIV